MSNLKWHRWCENVLKCYIWRFCPNTSLKIPNFSLPHFVCINSHRWNVQMLRRGLLEVSGRNCISPRAFSPWKCKLLRGGDLNILFMLCSDFILLWPSKICSDAHTSTEVLHSQYFGTKSFRRVAEIYWDMRKKTKTEQIRCFKSPHDHRDGDCNFWKNASVSQLASHFTFLFPFYTVCFENTEV